MNRCSFREWIPILPWPVWPLAGQFPLGQNVVVGSMMVLLVLCGSMPRRVCLDPRLVYNFTAPRFGVELPLPGHRGKTQRIEEEQGDEEHRPLAHRQIDAVATV